MSGIRSAFDVGRNEFEVTGHVPYFRKVVIPFADLDSTNYDYKIPVQAGTIVLGIGVKVDTGFNGNLPILDVGRSGDPDGFINDLAIATSNAFAYSGAIGSAAEKGGYYFAAADYILVDVNYTTTPPTSGALTILVHEVQVADNWRSLGDIGQNG
jgi:hypothetical protein